MTSPYEDHYGSAVRFASQMNGESGRRPSIGPDLADVPYPPNSQLSHDLRVVSSRLLLRLDALRSAGLGAVAAPLAEAHHDLHILLGAALRRLVEADRVRDQHDEKANELWAIGELAQGNTVAFSSELVDFLREALDRLDRDEEDIDAAAAVQAAQNEMKNLVRLVDGYDATINAEVAAGRLKRGSTARIRKAAQRYAAAAEQAGNDDHAQP